MSEIIERGQFLTVGEQFKRYTPQLERNAAVLDEDAERAGRRGDPCITWTGSRRGFTKSNIKRKASMPGQVRVTTDKRDADGKKIVRTMAAHRHAWNIVYGAEVPSEKAVMSICGNDLCINVNHRFIADIDSTSKLRMGSLFREELDINLERDIEDQGSPETEEATD